MKTDRVDLKELKRRLEFARVLNLYGISLQIKGDQATGFCPLPKHQSQRKSPSFSAHLGRGIWQCFGCGARGNVLDFAVLMEGMSPSSGADVRTVALKLMHTLSQVERPPSKTKLALVGKPSVLINAPLDFALKGLDPNHPYLRSRGLTDETVAYFGLGYCSRGIMKGRIVVPIHDREERLVGYAGRLVDGDQAAPKYLLPGKRDRKGVIHEFRKGLLLYNAHRIRSPTDHLVVVEGFSSVWWLHQHGFGNVVALMGSSCSPEQAEAIISMTAISGTVSVMPDGDEAGERCGHDVFEAVGVHRPVRWAKVPRGRQPTDLSAQELGRLADGW